MAQVSTELYEVLGRFTSLKTSFKTSTRDITVSARRKGNPRFLVTPVDVPWGPEVHVIALGLAFLQGLALHVDYDNQENFLIEQPQMAPH